MLYPQGMTKFCDRPAVPAAMLHSGSHGLNPFVPVKGGNCISMQSWIDLVPFYLTKPDRHWQSLMFDWECVGATLCSSSIDCFATFSRFFLQTCWRVLSCPACCLLNFALSGQFRSDHSIWGESSLFSLSKHNQFHIYWFHTTSGHLQYWNRPLV